MVAFVSGENLGLTTSSRNILGGAGQTGNANTGRNGEQVFVNSATGNLIIQEQDEVLTSVGGRASLVRTYNSLGLLDDDNGDNWRLGVHERVHGLTGTVNTTGSTITKTFGDGAEVVYTYDGSLGRYVSTDGDGAHDTLQFSSNTWTWTDGSSQNTETYDSSGRITASRDTDGNSFTYSYTGSLLTHITDVAAGQDIYFDYTGKNLTAIRVVSDGSTQTLTQYEYDAQDRLTTVRVDLSPEQASTDDGQVFTTRYTYDGSSRRIASITQQGTLQGIVEPTIVASFTYELIDGLYRVKTVTESNGAVTTLEYSNASGTSHSATTVTVNNSLVSTSQPGSSSYHLNDQGLWVLTGSSEYDRKDAALSTIAGQTLGEVTALDASATNPVIRFDAKGNGFSAYLDNGNVVVRQYNHAYDAWSEPTTLSVGSGAASTPALAVDYSGAAVIAWVQSDGTAQSLYQSTYDAVNETWSSAAVLETTSNPVSTASGSVSVSLKNGAGAVAWLQTVSGQKNVYVAALRNGVWGSPELVDAGSADASAPTVDVDLHGTLFVSWLQSDGTAQSIYYNTWDSTNQSWNGADHLDDSSTPINSVRSVAAGDGLELFAWAEGNSIYVRGYSRYSGEQPVQLLASGTSAPHSLSLSADECGNAVLAWVYDDGTGNSVYAARFDGGTGTWGAFTLVEAGTQPVLATEGSVTTSMADGKAVVAWIEDNGTHDELHGAGSDKDGEWDSVGVLATGSFDASAPSIAVSRSGDVTVVWQQTSGSATGVYQRHYYASATAPFYAVQAGDTWTSIAGKIYGIYGDTAGSVLQAAMGSPTLTAGLHLYNVPATLVVPAGNGAWGGGSQLASSGQQPQVAFDANGNGFGLFADGANLSVRRYTRATDTWSAAVTLDTGSTTVYSPAIAVDALGNAIVSWVQSDGTALSVYAKTFDATTSTWSSVSLLESNSGAVSTQPGSLSVALRGGVVAVAWLQSDGTRNNVYAARKTGGTWSSATLLETANANASSVNTSVDAQGKVLVLWQQSDGTAESLYYNRWDPGTPGAWTGAQLFELGASAHTRPQTVLSANGSLIVAWVEDGHLWTQLYTPESGLGSPREVDRYDGAAIGTYSLAINAATGDAILAWVQSDGESSSVFTSLFDYENNNWSSPTLLESNLPSVLRDSGSVVASYNGRFAAVAWLQSDGTHTNLYASRYDGCDWSTPTLLENSTAAASQPTIALDPQGNLAVLWKQSNGTTEAIYQQRYYQTKSTNWSDPVALESLDGPVTQLVSGADNAGHDIVVWEQGGKIYARSYDPATNIWTTAAVLSNEGAAAGSLKLDVDFQHGNAIVTWIDATTGAIRANRGGGFGSIFGYNGEPVSWAGPEFIAHAPPGTAFSQVSGSINADGIAAIVWKETTGTTQTISTRRYNGYYWIGTQTVESGTSALDMVQVAVTSAGISNVVWRSASGTGYRVNVRGFVEEDEYPTHQLNSADANVDQILIDADPYGEVNIVWKEDNDLFIGWGTADYWSGMNPIPPGSGTVDKMAFSCSLSDKAMLVWTTTAGDIYAFNYGLGTTQLIGSGTSISNLTVDIAQDGGAVVGWRSGGNLFAQRFVNGAWQGAQALESSSGAARDLALSISPEGGALDKPAMAVWVQNDGTADTLYFSRYQIDTTPIGSTKYYQVQEGDSWASIAKRLYGTSDVSQALQTALGNPTLTPGVLLANIPSTLTPSVVTVPAYYTVQSGDTWASITLAIYGTSDANAVAALRAATGDPSLTNGLHLTVPTALNYRAADGSALYLQTDITDALGHTTTILKDSEGRIVSMKAPETASGRLESQFEYDGDGNVRCITTGTGSNTRTTHFDYDDNGNLTLTRDPTGNTVTRTFSQTTNQLLTETVYTVVDPDGDGNGQPAGALTTRYVYDAESHLRFLVSAEGRVTEYRYNAAGLRTSTLSYTDEEYGVWALDPEDALTEGDLQTWLVGRDLSTVQRTDYTYDFRGNLSSETHYASTDSAGVGLETGSSTTHYVYDQRGQLISTITPDGERDGVESTHYVYDGLGRTLVEARRLSPQDLSLTVRSYVDFGLGEMSVENIRSPDGNITLRAYDGFGNLVITQTLDTHIGDPEDQYIFTHDAAGKLRDTIDGRGVHTHILYDEAGRQSGSIDGDGTLTQYFYDDFGQLVKTIVYADRVPEATLESMFDPEGASGSLLPPSVTVDTFVDIIEALPGRDPSEDMVTRRVYNLAGRLVYTIDDAGAVSGTVSDGAGRIISSTQYRNTLSIARETGALSQSDIDQMLSIDVDDRHTFFAYDDDGKLIGKLDAENCATQYEYDAAGRLIKETAYADPASGYTVTPDPEHDITTRYFYDGQGRQVGVLDGGGYLTATSYFEDGNVRAEVRYDQVLTYQEGDDIQCLLDQVDSETVSHTTEYQYDTAGRRKLKIDFEGTATLYQYDVEDRLVSQTEGWGADDGDDRTILRRYNARGQVVAELSPEGASLIGPNSTKPEIDEIWSLYSVKFEYDNSGLRSAMIDQNGGRTTYLYDADNRQAFVINPEGEITETEYDAFGRVVGTRAYANATSPIVTNPRGYASPSLVAYFHGLRSADDTVTSTTYDYTTSGRQSTTTTGLGNYTTVRTDAFGDVVERIQPTNGTDPALDHVYDYDHLGRLKRTDWDATATDHPFETREYDAFGRLKLVTDQYGNTTHTHYDRLGRVVSVQDPSGSLRHTDYDAFGRVLATYDAFNNKTSYAYNDQSRSVVVTTPENIQVTTYYTRHGQVLSVIDGNGNTTEYHYDENGKLTEVDDALGMLESRTYDHAGRQLTASDANLSVTSFQYDAANRLLIRTVDVNGLQLATHYEYDNLGRVINVTDERGIVTSTTYDADGHVKTLTVDPNGPNRSQTVYSYDLGGRLFDVVEGAGSGSLRHTQYKYDALGRRIEEIVDPTVLNIHTFYRYDDNGNLVRKIDGEGHSTWYVYDANDRLTYTIDALGGVTKTEYDAEGRLFSTRRYANSITPPDANTDRVTSVTISESLLDRRERHVYDADGREKFILQDAGTPADPQVLVTQKLYDKNGNVTRTRVISETIRADSIPEVDHVTVTTLTEFDVALGLGALLGLQTTDRAEWTTYDARNRAVFHVDAEHAVTRREYDKNGNVTRFTEFADVAPLFTTEEPDLTQWATAHEASALNRVTRTWYDGKNRAVITVDPMGYIRETKYDDALRTTTETAFVNRPPVQDGTSLPSLIQLMASYADPARDRTTITEYDSAGRVHRIYGPEYDPLKGNYEELGYDARGNKTSYRNQNGDLWTYEYDANNRLEYEHSPAVAVATATDFFSSISVATNTSLSLTTRIQYDNIGNVKSRTEAYGTIQARTTEYQYDLLGRQTVTKYPPAAYYVSSGNVTTDVSTGAPQLTGGSESLTSEVYYDALGNAIRSKDVAGNFSFKIYDRLGRVQYEVDALNYVTGYTYDSFGDQLTITRYAHALQTPLSSSVTSLDASAIKDGSNLPEDPSQDRTITKTYDRLGHVRSVLQPAGIVFIPTELTSGAGKYVTVSAQTWFEYDAFGELVRSRELSNPVAGVNNPYTGEITVGPPGSDPNVTWNDTDYYYDNRGNKRAEIGPDGALTTYEYDSVGNLKKKIEYAQLVTGANRWKEDFNLPAAHLPPGASDIGFDRTYEYKYDRLNRMTEERMTGFQSAALQSDGSIAVSNADRVVTYLYDEVGNRVAQGVNGRYTKYYYDKLGRLIGTAEPQRIGAEGLPVTPFTFRKVDAFGNVVEQIEYANGAIFDSEGGVYLVRAEGTQIEEISITNRNVAISVSGGSGENTVNPDRITRYAYDAHGKVVHTEDALGNDGYASYTASGDLAKEWQSVTDNSGQTGVIATLYQYDKLGRQTAVIEPQRINDPNSLPDIIIQHRSAYNAFGEILQNTTVGGAAVTYEYDQAGHMWRTNADDGVYKVYFYDLAGRVTTEIRSKVENLAGPAPTFQSGDPAPNPGVIAAGTYTSATGVAQSLTTANQIRKVTIYNAAGHVVEQVSPSFTSNGNTYTPYVRQQVDRWGEVTQYTDAAGNTTNYKYDQLGNVIEVKHPQLTMLTTTLVNTAVAGEHAATLQSSVTDRPTELNYYDANGWLIGTRDGNGNTNSMRFNEAGLAVQEYHADGGSRSMKYNAFGNLIEVQDENSFLLRQGYDKRGQLVWMAQEVVANAMPDNGALSYNPVSTGYPSETSIVVYQYGYDAAGRRITETDGAFMESSSSTPETTRYWYDLQGNLVHRATPMGNDTYFQYDQWGLGKKTRETNELFDQNFSTWTYDGFGRLTGHTDFTGNAFTYSYNGNVGWLESQAQTDGGQNIGYQYDEAGNIKKITDAGTAAGGYSGINRITDYKYDQAGRRTGEKVTIDGVVQQDTATSYDSRGNVASLSDDRYTTTYSYDAANNRTLIHSVWHGFRLTSPPTRTTETTDLYYAYDKMNRVSISQGKLGTFNDGTGTVSGIIVDKTQGIDITYDAKGQRKTARTVSDTIALADYLDDISGPTPVQHQAFANTTLLVTETYSYDGLGRLSQTQSQMYYENYVLSQKDPTGENPDAGVNDRGYISYVKDTRTYDGASREITHTYKQPLNVEQPDNKVYTHTRTSTYDDDGRIQTQEATRDAGSTDLSTPSTTIQKEFSLRYGISTWNPGSDPNDFLWAVAMYGGLPDYSYLVPVPPGYTLGWDAAGNLRGYTMVVFDPSNGNDRYRSTYTFTYSGRDSYLQVHQHVESSALHEAAPGAGDLTYSYNVNGELVRTADDYRPEDNRYFANNQSGQAITVVQGDLGTDAVAELGQAAQQVRGQADYATGWSSYHYFYNNGEAVGSVESQLGLIHGHFDVNYTAVSDNYPASVPSQVVVQEGESLRMIAARVFGDGSLWYILATENGLSEAQPDEVQPTGKVLRVPNEIISLSNTADTYKPYDASATIGDTTPDQPAPPPPRPRRKGCGTFGQILVLAVNIVVSYYYGPIAGNLAGQAVGLIIGQQSKFDWKSFAAVVITQGISEYTEFASLFEGYPAFVQGAAQSVLSQGVSIAVGAQDGFSWRAVAASAVGAQASSYVGTQLSESGVAIDRGVGLFLTQEAGALASVGVNLALGGKMSNVAVAADVFGNLLGNSLVASTARGSFELTPEQKRQMYGDIDDSAHGSMSAFDDPFETGGLLDLKMRQSNAEFEDQMKSDVDRYFARLERENDAARDLRMTSRDLEAQVRANNMSGSLDRALAAITPPEFDINFGVDPADTATVSLGYDFSYDLEENHSIALDPLFDLPPGGGYNPSYAGGSRQFVQAPDPYWERQQARQRVFLEHYDPQSASTFTMGYADIFSGGDPAKIEAAAVAGEDLDLAMSGITGGRSSGGAARLRRVPRTPRTPGTPGGGGPTPPVAGLLTGPSQGEQNALNGLEFERQVREQLRAPKGTDKYYSIDTRVGTIPDLPVGIDYGITEIKNEIELTRTPQFKTQLDLATQTKQPLNLIISPRVQTISVPLQARIRATGGRIFQYDPATQKFSNVVTMRNRVVR